MSAQATMHRRPRPAGTRSGAANAATPEAGTATPVAATPVPIGTAAARAGVSQRMVRHYEALGLLRGVARTDGGYRQYGEGDIHTLRFIRRARDLGFSMEEIAALLGLWQDQRRASREVKRIAQAHIDDLGRRIESMQAMQRSLQQLVGCCQGDGRPDCPILDDLAGASEG
ncbi:Cu(I)-responsive transcriptional regulator [Paracidovorax avenae]|uniref:Cu(I)-responsive transcriptional regulator n=1 Tax=Paracidovorax avenae TaxID=80867 RepID=UPI001CEFA530|nr:Cu(I)-responsive transcriptional regulator [Paracidovorax avenae]